MNGVSEYILSVTAAAVISAVVLRLLDGKGSGAFLGRVLTGVFVALTVIGPITQVRISDVTQMMPNVSTDAQTAVSAGQTAAKKSLAENISARLEAYILDKAAQLSVTLSVRVEVSDDSIPIPVRVYLQGDISPYAKSRLQNIIRDDLGLEKENQIWT